MTGLIVRVYVVFCLEGQKGILVMFGTLLGFVFLFRLQFWSFFACNYSIDTILLDWSPFLQLVSCLFDFPLLHSTLQIIFQLLQYFIFSNESSFDFSKQFTIVIQCFCFFELCYCFHVICPTCVQKCGLLMLGAQSLMILQRMMYLVPQEGQSLQHMIHCYRMFQRFEMNLTLSDTILHVIFPHYYLLCLHVTSVIYF